MFKRLNNPLYLLGFLSVSCISLESSLPLNRFDQPEALGSDGREFFFQTTRVAQVTHVPDIDEDPPRLNSAEMKHDSSAQVGLSLGLKEKWDLQISYRPLYAKTKYQLLGRNSPNAKKNNFSLAVGLGGGVLESVGDDVEFDGDSNRAEIDLTFVEASLAVGWRPWSSLLISHSVFAQNINGTGKLKTETGQSYGLRQDGTINGASFGLHWFYKKIVLSGDFNRSFVSWTNGASHETYDSVAGRVSLRF